MRINRRAVIGLGSGVAIVAAVVAIVLTVGSGGSSAAGGVSPRGSGSSSAPTSSGEAVAVLAPACPTQWHAGIQLWVPAQPTSSDASKRLAPTSAPGGAVLCAYLDADHGYLSGTRILTSNLTTLASVLSSAPDQASASVKACPLYFRAEDADNFLIGLNYPAGVVWVSAPAYHCQGASNGVFTTADNLGETARTWYSQGVPAVAPTASSS